MPSVNVAVLGATGMVGQRFISLLQGHPWFQISAITGSERTAGKTYGEACRWVLDTPMPAAIREMPVLPSDARLDAPLIFSALPSSAAGPLEERLAQAGHIVCSNASNHRMAPDVPLLVPEVNPDHLELIDVQRRRRGWSGAIVTNPNCTSTPLVMALRPLIDTFGVRTVMMVSLQALSGAGYPGIPSYDAVDNAIPYIGGEEPKVESEPQKMLGTLRDGEIELATFRSSAHCNRVPLLEGHLICVSVGLERTVTPSTVAEAMREFRAAPQELSLPSAPANPLVLRSEDDRPQPRRDRDVEKGMATVVGRVRDCPLFDVKFVAMAHNTIRGAAGGSLLNAELMLARGYLG